MYYCIFIGVVIYGKCLHIVFSYYLRSIFGTPIRAPTLKAETSWCDLTLSAIEPIDIEAQRKP